MVLNYVSCLPGAVWSIGEVDWVLGGMLVWMMDQAVPPTHFVFLQSWEEQLPHQAVMHPNRIFLHLESLETCRISLLRPWMEIQTRSVCSITPDVSLGCEVESGNGHSVDKGLLD